MTPLPSSRARALRVAALAVGILAAGIAPARADATPPVATAAAPAALAASSIVTFSEDVRNVTTANLLIRVTGTTDPLEAGISCRTRAGEPTSCSIGRVRVAHLNPRPVLLSGRKYTVVVNPSGASPIRDWSGNAARSSTMTFRAPVEQEETSPRATFSWRSVPDARAFGGSYRTDDTRGATSSFAFTGTSVTWYTVVGAGQGKALVAIDGVNRPEVNNYAERTSFRVARRYGGLGPGGHRITIRALGEKGSVLGSGASVAVDAFAVDGTHVTAPAVTYRWAGVSSASASGGRFARTDQPGARVRFAFFGKGIDWYTVTGPDQGSVDVFVDGTFRYRYDNYAGATAYGVRRGIAGLYEAVHAIVLVVRADRNELSTAGYVSIDRWYVRYPSISTFRRLGAWVDLYDYGSLDPSDAVADLDARGVRTLYLQTARYNTDADVAPVVGGWIERAHAAGMRVVGWYLPAYDEFMATDVRRTVAIARYSSPGGHRFDALAIDIEYRGKCETREEFMDGIKVHLARVRKGVGNSYPVGAIVPAPLGMAISPSHWQGFPWGHIGRYADAVLPMGYWSYRTDCPENPDHCAYGYSAGNIERARDRTGLPVHEIGGVANRVTSDQVVDFVRATRDAKALGGSLYDYRTTAGAFWSSLRNLNLL